MDKADQQKFYKNLNEASFYFFVMVGIAHILSGLLVANEAYTKPAWLINRILDIPFLAVSYIYLMSIIKLHLLSKGNYSRLFDLYSAIIGGILLLSILVIDLYLDNQLPLT